MKKLLIIAALFAGCSKEESPIVYDCECNTTVYKYNQLPVKSTDRYNSSKNETGTVKTEMNPDNVKFRVTTIKETKCSKK